jgi:biopolymer transport protein ExbD
MAGAVGVGKGPRSDINITPLVDVVLVLLIIFMVLTPLMEKELAVRVPEDTKDEVVPPPDPNEQTWLFKVDDQGRFTLNGTVYADDAIGEPLRSAFKAAKAKGEAVIFFDADDKAKYARAVKGLDAIRDSVGGTGWTIGMMTEELPATPGTPDGDAPAPK